MAAVSGRECRKGDGGSETEAVRTSSACQSEFEMGHGVGTDALVGVMPNQEPICWSGNATEPRQSLDAFRT